MLKVAILGANGYTGLELLRILALHPEVKVVHASSRQYKGQCVTAVFPFLTGFYDALCFDDTDASMVDADIFFCALPHGASQEAVEIIHKSGRRVVDLSADFRLSSPQTYAKWYGEHRAEELLSKAVYGLPEVRRDEVRGAKIVANPGCYPTSAILALYPILKRALMGSGPIIIDSKSGASGAGRGASIETSFVEVTGAFKAYKVGTHRHTPEIEQELSLACGSPVEAIFTPHLLPVSRGILTTAYVQLKEPKTTSELRALYAEHYARERFVRVMPEGKFPDISQVRGSNFCDIGVYGDGRGRAVIVSAIDNLVKGASGQAVQNMNIMAGFDEGAALNTLPLSI